MKTIEIKKWMLDEGLTQQAIVRKTRVSQPMVALVLQGKRGGPKGKKVIRALKRLGCPKEFLLKEEEVKNGA